MPVNFGNLNRVSKVIHIDVINEVRRLCFGSALLRALFFEKVKFSKNDKIWKNMFLYEYCLPTLRVGRQVTRLTVHWAL